VKFISHDHTRGCGDHAARHGRELNLRDTFFDRRVDGGHQSVLGLGKRDDRAIGDGITGAIAHRIGGDRDQAIRSGTRGDAKIATVRGDLLNNAVLRNVAD